MPGLLNTFYGSDRPESEHVAGDLRVHVVKAIITDCSPYAVVHDLQATTARIRSTGQTNAY